METINEETTYGNAGTYAFIAELNREAFINCVRKRN
jgi:hypothetical protein